MCVCLYIHRIAQNVSEGSPVAETEDDRKPLQDDDQANSNIDVSQQEEAVTSEEPGYTGSAPGAAATDKWLFFSHSNVSRSATFRSKKEKQ